MDQKELRQWEQSIDVADSSPITANLPADTRIGEEFVDESASDGVVRRWLRVEVVAGNPGARWAYWLGWIDEKTKQAGIGPHPDVKVVADKIFNGDATHFLGMLGVPYAGKVAGVESTAWVLVSPKQQGPVTVHVREEKPKERYEKSKEVHDVETGKTTLLP